MKETSSKTSARLLKLDIYDEVVGRIKEVKRNEDVSTLLIEIPPTLLAVEIPLDSLVGDIPPTGTLIALLRTKTDFRIKREMDGEPSSSGIRASPKPKQARVDSVEKKE